MRTPAISFALPSGLSRSLAILLLGGLALAACDDNGGDGDDDGIASLGDDFEEAFGQAPNDEPLEASDLELELTPTIEPFEL